MSNVTFKSARSFYLLIAIYTFISHKLLRECGYKETTNPIAPIRRITIGLNNLQDDYMASISLFDDVEADEKEKKLREAVVDIKKKYGKNIILKGISYTEKATARSRNKMVGGHNGGD